MIRRHFPTLLLVGTAALFAVALAFGLRQILPYEMLERETPEERFIVWEGILWMIGLSLVFFGSAALFGSPDLVRTRMPGLDETYSFGRSARHSSLVFSPGAVWAIAAGLTLLLIALRARSALGG